VITGPLGTEHPFAVTEGESLSCVWLPSICYEEVLQPVIGLCKGNLLSKIQMETVAHAAVTLRKWLPGIQEARVAFHIGEEDILRALKIFFITMLYIFCHQIAGYGLKFHIIYR
jgi:hypothetical protein